MTGSGSRMRVDWEVVLCAERAALLNAALRHCRRFGISPDQADDAVQQACLELIQDQRNGKSSGDVKEPMAYAATVVWRKLADILRKQGRDKKWIAEEYYCHMITKESQNNSINAMGSVLLAIRVALYLMIPSLQPAKRIVFERGFSMQDLAEILISENLNDHELPNLQQIAESLNTTKSNISATLASGYSDLRSMLPRLVEFRQSVAQEEWAMFINLYFRGKQADEIAFSYKTSEEDIIQRYDQLLMKLKSTLRHVRIRAPAAIDRKTILSLIE